MVFEPGSEYTRYPFFVVVMSHASFPDLVLTDFRSFPSRLYSAMTFPWTVVQMLSSLTQLTLPRLPSFLVAMVLITFVSRGKGFVTMWPSLSCVTLENVTKPNLLYRSFSSIRCATYSGSGSTLLDGIFFEFSIHRLVFTSDEIFIGFQQFFQIGNMIFNLNHFARNSIFLVFYRRNISGF